MNFHHEDDEGMIVHIYDIKMYHQSFEKLNHKFDRNYEPEEIKIRNDKILIIKNLINLIRKIYYVKCLKS
jgi:hypothetical protein